MEENYPVMVSIECCVFNHEPYLRQCLDGFVMQKTNFPFEAIVHDDASTDGSASIILEYADRYPDIIKPIIETENQYSKRDNTLRKILDSHIRGKYIAWCEGDDYWIDPNKLQKQVDFLESHLDYVLTYTDAEVVNDKGERIFHNTTHRYSGNVTRQLVEKGNFIVTAGTCFRNNSAGWLEERNKIPCDLRVGDKPMWIYYSTLGKFKFFDEKMVAYRVLRNSASHSDDFDKVLLFKESGQSIAKYFNKLYSLGIDEKTIDYGYAKGRVRAAAKISRAVFIKQLRNEFKDYPKIVFYIKLWAIAFIRVVLNRAV